MRDLQTEFHRVSQRKGCRATARDRRTTRPQNVPMDCIGNKDEIARLVARQDAQTLAQVLLELAEDYASVYQRLKRLKLSADPAALTAQFNQRLHGWEDDHRYVRYQDAGAFGRELDVWVGESWS